MAAWLERNAFLVIALAGSLLLAGLIARDVVRSPQEPVLTFRDGGPTVGTPIRVHVVGAVAAPGVYQLASGDRVEDAVDAAGGPAPGADLESINLARRVRDGEQINIAGAGVSAAPVVGQTGLLDLNSATREQLMALPGIGEAYSQRIVDSRLVDGPFSSVDELLGRNLVPERTLDGIRSLITVVVP